MKRTTSLNLTSGPILKTLSELALPIMASSMLGTAYNITDMAWIGMLGAKAVAGVGVGGMYVWLSQGLASLPRMGGQVHAAQACGRGDYEKARSYASSAIQLSLLFGLLFSAACVLFIDPLLGFFQLGDAKTYASARSYMLITCGLLVFSYLNLTLTGLSTAQGDSKTPLMANLLGLISNMILDPMLILGIGPFPRLETVGAAIATVTAQILVFLVLLIKSLRAEEPNILRSIRLFTRFPANYYKDIFRIGLQLINSVFTGIVKLVARCFQQERVFNSHTDLCQLFVLCNHGIVGRQQAVMEALDDDHGQNNQAVFMGLVCAKKAVGNIPDDRRLLLDVNAHLIHFLCRIHPDHSPFSV